MAEVNGASRARVGPNAQSELGGGRSLKDPGVPAPRKALERFEAAGLVAASIQPLKHRKPFYLKACDSSAAAAPPPLHEQASLPYASRPHRATTPPPILK